MSESNDSQPMDEPQVLTQRRIFYFWLPLAASWLLMGTEMPFVNAVMARMSEAERMIAAFGVVASISLAIESPVIPLLSTSTALARSGHNYRLLRKFTVHLMFVTTFLHILVAWTPAFDLVVRNWLGAPQMLIEPIRLGLRIMILWSAAIAWRRFRQGLLIRFGETRSVGQGTAIRLISSAGTAALLGIFSPLPGIAVGTLALIAGVLAEAIFAHWVSRNLVNIRFSGIDADSDPSNITYRSLFAFHSPLAASALLFLITLPMISAALARIPDAQIALAAWPVTSGLFFMVRTPVVALPEVIIALLEERGSHIQLRRFSLKIGVICTLVLGLLSFTPLADTYFQSIIGLPEHVAVIASVGSQFGLFIPLIIAWQSWFRGVLTANRVTMAITMAMLVNLLTMAVILFLGVHYQLRGVRIAAIALSVSALMEMLILRLATQRKRLAK